MPQAVQFGEARPQSMALIYAKLLHVLPRTRNLRALAGQPVGTIEQLSLLARPDRNDSRLATLGPGWFQNEVITLIGIGKG